MSKRSRALERSVNSGGKDDTFRANEEDEELEQLFKDEDALDIDMNINIEKQEKDITTFSKFDQEYTTQDVNGQCLIITGRRNTAGPADVLNYKPCKLMQVDINGHKISSSQFAQFQVPKT